MKDLDINQLCDWLRDAAEGLKDLATSEELAQVAQAIAGEILAVRLYEADDQDGKAAERRRNIEHLLRQFESYCARRIEKAVGQRLEAFASDLLAVLMDLLKWIRA